MVWAATFRRGKHKPAIEECRIAVEIDPSHAKAYNAMGVSYDALGDHGRAVESYRRLWLLIRGSITFSTTWDILTFFKQAGSGH